MRISKRSIPKRELLLKEFRGRSFDANTGGCKGRKILTAYKEQAIKIAYYIRNSVLLLRPNSKIDLIKLPTHFIQKLLWMVRKNRFWSL